MILCIGCDSLCHRKGALFRARRKPCGPNMLDELLKGFIVIPADLHWKGVKRLATSGERVNHDSWVKMCNLCRVLKTVILAVLTVKSSLGDSCINGDDSCVLNMLIIYYLMLYIICHIYHEIVGNIQSSSYTCGVRHGLTLAISPKPQEKFRLVINQSVGSCRVELIPKVWSYLSVVCYQRLSLLY